MPRTMRPITPVALVGALLAGAACDTPDNDGADTEGRVDTDVTNDPDGGCTVSRCTEDVAPPGGDQHDFAVVQQFSTEDRAVALSLAWHIGEGDAVGETFPFEMLRFGVCEDPGGVCISDQAEMSYEWRHHNWDETITAQSGGREYIVRMSLSLSEATGWTDTLEIRDLGSAVTLTGPVPLLDQGCRTVPPNNANACIYRDRLD